MTPDKRSVIRATYELCCAQEVDALKPGNVHRFADGHGMSVADFLTSATVSSDALTDPALPLGRRILEAVKATRKAVNTNTNLGIILLCAPVAIAAETNSRDIHDALRKVLGSMTMDDAADVFQAITTANPGGLGSGGTNDVRETPRIGLLDAMREAASRDRIAYQYANTYADIFETGLPALQGSETDGMWAAIDAYLAFLSTFPDSHIARKFGMTVAETVREEAAIIRAQLPDIASKDARIGVLMEFDRSLKSRNLNPGTSADLTVCCLFVHKLMQRLA